MDWKIGGQVQGHTYNVDDKKSLRHASRMNEEDVLFASVFIISSCLLICGKQAVYELMPCFVSEDMRHKAVANSFCVQCLRGTEER